MTRTQRLRKTLEKAAEGSDLAPDQYPPPDLDGWVRSPVDLGRLVAATQALWVRPSHQLIGYQVRSHGDGSGVVWAVPAETPAHLLESWLCSYDYQGRFRGPPRPDGAIEHFMDVIEGDRSPWSFLAASLIMRELNEFGASWHGLNWRTHALVCRDPWKFPKRESSGLPDQPHTQKEEWRWVEPLPEDLRPAVDVDEQVTVTFYSFSALGREVIVRYVDRYNRDSYRCVTEDTVIGEGGGGYIF